MAIPAAIAKSAKRQQRVKDAEVAAKRQRCSFEINRMPATVMTLY